MRKQLPALLIFLGVVLVIIAFGPFIRDEVWFYLKELKGQEYELGADVHKKDSVFARLLSSRPIGIDPANKDFSIVIEKIGVSAPINKDVPVTDNQAYMESLRTGVAHASLSKYPSKNPGNTYLFAHASVNFWKLGKYAGVFNLLRKLDTGDKIYIFYEGRAYMYKVANIEIVKGWDVYSITRPVIEPILTLQTCDPPGTTLNRLVVTAKLVSVE